MLSLILTIMSGENASLWREDCRIHRATGSEWMSPSLAVGEQGLAGAVASILFLQQPHLKDKRGTGSCWWLCDFLHPERNLQLWHSFPQVPSFELQKSCSLGKDMVSEMSVFSAPCGSVYVFAAKEAGMALSQVPKSSYILCIEIRYLTEVITLPVTELLRNCHT